jgi:3-dehydroquinate synthase
MKIVLTGFMGVGKTSVGEELSRRLGYPFTDTDVLIEEREGMPISLIFKEKGEDYFRKVERSVVEEVSLKGNVVIATGGGVIKDKKNVENLRRRGIIIWLKADPGIILKRVMLEEGKRPLLDVEEPLNEIKRLLSEREGYYLQSDLSIDTNYITPGEAAQEIMEKLNLDMQEVTLELKDRSYKIVIGRRAVRNLAVRLKEFRPSKVAIISNKTVFPLYNKAVLESFGYYGMTPEVFLLPDGEEYKDLQWASNLYGELLKARFDRQSILVALGGGVVGDITGFVASTYMRGIKYVQVPTTLLAQVDSSVGGKTGVNHPLGKNMIGTFFQPSLVLIDIDTLKTLPRRELSAGIAEIIKYGVIADERLFNFLELNSKNILLLGDGLIHALKRSCEIKAEVVSKDERESGLRAILNFGHTIGHAIETVSGYRRFLHGEAIAVGMCCAADLSVRLGILERKESERIRGIVELYNLPVNIPGDIGTTDIIDTMQVDKKVRSGKLRFILPETIGRVRIEEGVDLEVVREVLDLNKK